MGTMRKARLLGALVAMGAVVVAAPSAGATGATRPTVRFVAPTGRDSGACATPATACRTIGLAVAAASPGDVVRVAPGRYPEQVVVDKALAFVGPNAGRRAGVGPVRRGPEAYVQGFRSPGYPYPKADMAFSVTIDGFRIDPLGDATIIAGGQIPLHLVSLFGGPSVSVRNNVFSGGPFVPDCSSTCTTMADFALLIQSGRFEVRDNLFTNFRRPVDISQNDAAHPITGGVLSGNAFTHITSRAVWLREGDCWGPNGCGGGAVDTAAPIAVVGNRFDNTGSLSPDTGGPAGLVMTTSGNLVAGNTFTGNDPAVFDQVCDPWNHPVAAPNRFVGNRFAGNVDGIMYYAADPGSCPSGLAAQIHGNQFTGNSGHGVRWYPPATAPGPLDATCNWWGSAAGPGSPGADRVTAEVTATPWNLSPLGRCTGS